MIPAKSIAITATRRRQRDSPRWLHAEDARTGYAERLSPQLEQNYAAYVAGLKRFMADHPDEVPPGTPELEPWHVVAFSHAVLSAYHINDGLTECAAAGVKLARDLDPLDPANGGNRRASDEWLVAPWRTVDDAMIVLSDPHGGIDGGLFYEFRMHAEQRHAAHGDNPSNDIESLAHPSVGVASYATLVSFGRHTMPPLRCSPLLCYWETIPGYQEA